MTSPPQAQPGQPGRGAVAVAVRPAPGGLAAGGRVLSLFLAMPMLDLAGVWTVAAGDGLGGLAMIVGMLPMHNAIGFNGTIAIAIDVRWLDYMVRTKQLPEGAVVAIFDQNGTVIAANKPKVAKPIFAHANAVRNAGQDLYTANSTFPFIHRRSKTKYNTISFCL